MVDTWSDNDNSNEDESMDDELTNLCLMAQDEPMVNSNPCYSTLYTFDVLQDAFDNLVLKFETMRSKYSKMITKLKIENEILLKAEIELDSNNDELKLILEFSQMNEFTCVNLLHINMFL